MPCLSCNVPQKKAEKYYITLVLYLVLFLIIFIGHKSVLMYSHLMVLEYFEQVVIMEWSATQVILVDGIPSYFSATITIILLFAMSIVACACNIQTQKSFITIVTGFTLVLMCICTIAQISVVIYKDITLFLDLKAPDIAECFCLDESNSTASTSALLGPSLHMNLQNSMSMYKEAPVELRSDSDSHYWLTQILDIVSHQVENCTLYWCRCNVPGEEYPVGFSVTNVGVITVDYLKQYLERNEYEGTNVTTTVVSTKDELMYNTDTDFYDMKMLLGMAELSVLFVVLRLPMFVIAKKAKVAEAESKTKVQGSGLESYIFRAIQHVQFKAKTSETFKAFLGIVVFAFVESLDSYTLLDDIIEHRYTFGNDRALTNATLSLVLLNIIVVNGSGIVVFLGDKPPRGVDNVGDNTVYKAMEITKLVVVILSNMPFMALRIYLLYVYDGFGGTQIGSVYVIFIIKEVVLFTLGIAEFSMTSEVVTHRGSKSETRASHHFSNGGVTSKWMTKAKQLHSNRKANNGSKDFTQTSETAMTSPFSNGAVRKAATTWMTKANVVSRTSDIAYDDDERDDEVVELDLPIELGKALEKRMSDIFDNELELGAFNLGSSYDDNSMHMSLQSEESGLSKLTRSKYS